VNSLKIASKTTDGNKKGWGRNLSPFKPYPNYENPKECLTKAVK
jgi:hypothetical protein